MKDIVLTHGYFLNRDQEEDRTMKPYVPLGILSIAAWLKQHGASVRVFDSTFASFENFHRALSETNPLAVGIYVTLMTKQTALEMVRVAHDAGSVVIVGGPDPASYADEYLHLGVDVVVFGEGEETLVELVDAIRFAGAASTQPDYSHIRGIKYIDFRGQLIRTPDRALIRDIDGLPFPDRGSVDLEHYMNVWRSRHGYASLSLSTMRGCPYTCTWCSHSVYGESYRRRSPVRVADEMNMLRQTYRPDALWFVDDVFTINHRWIFELAEELRTRDIRIPFECISRADRINMEIVVALKQMGCTRVWIGAESGSQKILDAMQRGVTISEVENAISFCRSAGIETGTFIMLGYAGETITDILETAAYLRRARPDIVLTTTAYPIKGTRYYETITEYLAIPQRSFQTWTDRDIAVTNRYPPRFYWFAHRFVMNEAAHARAWSMKRRLRSLIHFLKARIAYLGMKASAGFV